MCSPRSKRHARPSVDLLAPPPPPEPVAQDLYTHNQLPAGSSSQRTKADSTSSTRRQTKSRRRGRARGVSQLITQLSIPFDSLTGNAKDGQRRDKNKKTGLNIPE